MANPAYQYPPIQASFFAVDTYKPINQEWVTWFNQIAVLSGNGAVLGGTNVGTLGQGTFKQRSGTNLQFRNVAALDTTISIALDANNNITVGSAITGSNVGTLGQGVFKQKTGATLEFRNVAALDTTVAVALDGNNNITIGANTATQANMEGESGTNLVIPTVVKYNPGVAKAWVKFTSSTTIDGSYNVASITDNGPGDFTINFTTAFSSAHYAIVAMAGTHTAAAQAVRSSTLGAVQTTTACRILYGASDVDGTLVVQDENYNSAVFYGDQ